MLTRVSLILLAIGLIALVIASYVVSAPVHDGTRSAFAPEIASRQDAMTFARSQDGLILVTAHEGDAITGIALHHLFADAAQGSLLDLLPLVNENVLNAAPSERFLLSELKMPLAFTYPHVAAGTNFKEHADEIYSDDPPFLFPKLVEATAWNQPIPFVPRLDYEAELCMFPLEDITRASELPRMGLILCNDFTDRWTLVTELDLSQPLGLTGFATGKGCTDCLPTGYLVVIPKSDQFYRSLNLQLYVNDSLRQSFSMIDVILGIEDIVQQAMKHQSTRYENGDTTVPLLSQGSIKKGSLILTGTAAGVMFRPLNIWRQGFYLQPGDVVWTEATYLGHLRNQISQ